MEKRVCENRQIRLYLPRVLSAIMEPSAAALQANLAKILGNIQTLRATHKIQREVALVAVSKKKPNSLINTAYQAGQRHFGENYVQEFVGKAPDLPKDIKWHFIGHLQGNKCKTILKIPNLYMVQTVHSMKLADKLNQACVNAERKDKLNILVQVNTSGEAAKSGVEPSKCKDLVKHVLSQCSQLAFRGFMTIGQYDPSPRTDDFEALVACRDEVCKTLDLKPEDMELSMGMSHDYALAVRLGATIVRVGSSIFGQRT